MRPLLAIPLLAGVLFPPAVSAQVRLGPRSFGTAPAKSSGHFVPRLPAPAPPDTTGGNFSVVRAFPSATTSPWSKPGPFGSFGRGFGRRSFHGQGFLLVNPFSFGYPFSYAYGADALAFYPSLWQPIDQQYLQAWQIAHGDSAGEVASQQNQLLAGQVQALTDQVESLSRESASPAPITSQAAVQTKHISTAFVYRDGRVVEARNYAILGQTLWIFGAETTHRIPLSALNLPATRQMNEDRGIDVTLPGSH
jgi:hypothetical protein